MALNHSCEQSPHNLITPGYHFLILPHWGLGCNMNFGHLETRASIEGQTIASTLGVIAGMMLPFPPEELRLPFPPEEACSSCSRMVRLSSQG